VLKNWQRAGFGLYIHWPFCQAKCPYCDFNSHVSKHIDQEAWRTAYLSEIERVYELTPNRVLGTIFFGGGTPSLISPKTVNDIIKKIKSLWKTANNFEITLEANPTSVEGSLFCDYRSAGVNRISLGIQALDDLALKKLGRLHTVTEAKAALEIACSIFERVNFDLIYARQDQSLKDWEKELLSALKLKVKHLSLYQLTIEDGTVFGKRAQAGKLPGLPTETLSTDMYFLTQNIMSDNSFNQYEISNHALTEEKSRHNLIYWRGGDFIGIGPGAHGRLSFDDKRWATVEIKTPQKWLNYVNKLGSGEESKTLISKSDEALEYLMMSTRLAEGCDIDVVSRLDTNLLKVNKIKELENLGFIYLEKNRLIPTPQGRVILNTLLSELI
jgi:putative oxygen-independent coproporphyrinogen III oxidase